MTLPRPVVHALVASLVLAPTGASAQVPEPTPEPAPAPGEEPAPVPGEAEEPTDGLPTDDGPLEIRPTEAAPEEDPEPPVVPLEPDQVGGKLWLGAGPSWAIPFGSFESGVNQTDLIGAGPGFDLTAGYGFGRYVVLGLWGQLHSYGSSDHCSDCSATSIGLGAFVRYHLVQGQRFDPWMSAGIGYRTTSVSAPAGDITYSGIEVLRMEVGGDWFPWDSFGFGPTAQLAVGRYLSRSEGDLGDTANHWAFSVGVRGVFVAPPRRAP